MGTAFHCMTGPKEAASSTGVQLDYARAEGGSVSLKRAINAAVARQADAWGIRTDQARALLFDWRKVA